MDGAEEVWIVLWGRGGKCLDRRSLSDSQEERSTFLKPGDIPVQQVSTSMYLNEVDQSLLELGFAAGGFGRIGCSRGGGRGLGGRRRDRQGRRFTERRLEGAGREKHRIVGPRNRQAGTLRDSLEADQRKITTPSVNVTVV